jgi:hypothetical protein
MDAAVAVTRPHRPDAPVAQPVSDCYLACTSPAVVRTTQPTLTVAVSDADGGILSTVFEVRTAPSRGGRLVASNAQAPALSPSGGQAGWTVPAGRLDHGGTYYWTARSTDEGGRTGPASSWQTLAVDTEAPVTVSVASPQYPFKQWGAPVGTPGDFTFVGSSDTAEFRWSVDGGSSSTVTATGDPKTATVRYTPLVDLVHVMHVTTLDIAGNTSATFDYEFWVSPPPALCWYWRLDESSGTIAADSGGDLCPGTPPAPGSLVGAVDWTTGHVGNAAVFTGGAITMGRPVVDGNASFTIAAWVNPANIAAGDQTAVALLGSTGSRFQLHYDAEANAGAGGWCFSMSAADGDAPVSACATGTLPDDSGATHEPRNGEWVHLAGVYNAPAGTIEIHVMGNQAFCSGELVRAPFTGSWTSFEDLVMGNAKAAGTVTERWHGAVDDVHLYQRVLSGASICVLAAQ